MKPDQLPIPLARAAMRIIPAGLLQRMIGILMRSMRHRHPRLFHNLTRLDAAVICIKPSDLPHQFVLKFGQGPTSLTLAGARPPPYHACVKGKLVALLDLLEGRIDSDMLFFSRAIEITGDTSMVVALRNTLDREEINLLEDVTTLCGPFAKPSHKAVVFINKAAERVKDRLAKMYEERHPSLENTHTKLECDDLRVEIQALKTRFAKFDVREKRTKAAAL